MISCVESAACIGINASPIRVETDVSAGLPQMNIVGLPDSSVRESRERVRAAIRNSGFEFPPDRITINLAPADIRKEGPAFDLPIALGILSAAGIIPADKLAGFRFLGELALNGALQPFKGAIVVSEHFKDLPLIIPEANAREASLSNHPRILTARHLSEIVSFLKGEADLPQVIFRNQDPPPDQEASRDFSEVKGQAFAKRAIEIATAGGHNLLLIGSPGSGKTMLSQRIPTILPPLSRNAALEVTKIHSVAGTLRSGCTLIRHHPFRSPHHTASVVAMAGGGSWPRPGEISLAHHGVLFLDEFPEFRRDVIETLRGPLEAGEISIARARMHLTFPARTMLVAAMNPCPCGFLSDPRRTCRCSPAQIHKYRARISGPILDRIDLHVEVPTLTYQALTCERPTEDSKTIRQRVLECRRIQAQRYRRQASPLNAHMRSRDLKEFARPDTEGMKLLEHAMKDLHLSARAYYKILKIARTLADLAEEETVRASHIAEAIQYRSLDRPGTAV